MPRTTSPALKNLVIDLPGATLTLKVSATPLVAVESNAAVDHAKRLTSQARILRWKNSPARGRRSGNNAVVINSGDAIASGPGSFANTGITDGWEQAAPSGGPVTIEVPSTVTRVTIRNAADFAASDDFKAVIKDAR